MDSNIGLRTQLNKRTVKTPVSTIDSRECLLIQLSLVYMNIRFSIERVAQST